MTEGRYARDASSKAWQREIGVSPLRYAGRISKSVLSTFHRGSATTIINTYIFEGFEATDRPAWIWSIIQISLTVLKALVLAEIHTQHGMEHISNVQHNIVSRSKLQEEDYARGR